jgi:dCTP deaminase
MILGGNYLRAMHSEGSEEKILEPFCERTVEHGLSYGCGFASYDVRIDLDHPMVLNKGDYRLAATVEHFTMPNWVSAVVHDKSSWARRGLAVQNTFIDPGWRGYLTLELTMHGDRHVELLPGMAIAQIVFHHVLTADTYDGKYQDQERGPQEAR